MKKWQLPIAALLMAASVTGVAFAKGYVKDFSMEYDEPLCIVETDFITMEVNSIDVDDDYLVIDTLVTNSNSDRGYEVSVTRASINGLEVYPTYSEDVEPDDECSEPIEIDLSTVIENTDITDISDIELAITIEDDDMEVVYKDTVHIFPHGEDQAQRYVRVSADTDNIIVDNENFKVTVTGYEYIRDWGYSVRMYIENKTDETVYIEGEDFSINDTDASTWYFDYVGANGASFSPIEWSQSDLDDAEITEVTEIAFTLNIYDEEAEDLLYSNTIKLNP